MFQLIIKYNEKSVIYYNSLSNEIVRVIYSRFICVANDTSSVNLTNKCQQFKSND